MPRRKAGYKDWRFQNNAEGVTQREKRPEVGRVGRQRETEVRG
jgi:hypothetical protein